MNLLDGFNVHARPFCKENGIEIIKNQHYIGIKSMFSFRENLLATDFAIIFLTPNFLDEYCDEIRILGDLAISNTFEIIPVILKPCLIRNRFLKDLEPIDVKDSPDIDSFWVKLLKRISNKYSDYLPQEYNSNHIHKKLTISKVRAGYPIEFIDDDEDIEEFKFCEFPFRNIREDDKVFRVKGRSMEPKYFQGDYIHCRIITDDVFFCSPNKNMENLFSAMDFEKAYVFETRTRGLVLKRLSTDKEHQNIILRSDNIDYPNEIIAPFEIVRVWKILRTASVRDE